MSLTASNQIKLGTRAPDFSLLNTVSNTFLSLQDSRGKNGTLILFICNHCPFVLHVNDELVKLANDYFRKGISVIAISSNDIVTHPQDGPKEMKERAKKLEYPFPYLYDETQHVAKAYDAACTPDFYVFDNNLKAVYHGQLDESRPGNNIAVTGKDIRNVLDRLLEKKTINTIQQPSIGCNIKWK